MLFPDSFYQYCNCIKFTDKKYIDVECYDNVLQANNAWNKRDDNIKKPPYNYTFRLVIINKYLLRFMKVRQIQNSFIDWSEFSPQVYIQYRF